MLYGWITKVIRSAIILLRLKFITSSIYSVCYFHGVSSKHLLEHSIGVQDIRFYSSKPCEHSLIRLPHAHFSLMLSSWFGFHSFIFHSGSTSICVVLLLLLFTNHFSYSIYWATKSISVFYMDRLFLCIYVSCAM